MSTDRLVRWAGAAERADQHLFRLLGRQESAVLDRWMPRVSRAADYSRLWLVVAAALVASGRPAWRRAAVRGAGSLLVASATVNGLAKVWVRRGRPPLHTVPVRRRVVRTPVTTSFPSGHTASAAAFATGAATEAPELAVPLGLLAAAVAWSRIWTGAHYPIDVAAGAALGGGLATVVAELPPRRRRGR